MRQPYVEVEKILLSATPQALGEGEYAAFLQRLGLIPRAPLAVLDKIPCLRVPRWWALCLLCDIDPVQLARQADMAALEVREMKEYTRLYRLGLSRDVLDLKQKLCSTALDYHTVIETFAALRPEFAAERATYRALLASGEPFRPEHLVVTADMLRRQGVRGEKNRQAMQRLLGLVIRAPQLNRRALLLGVAREMKGL